jgi:hypothetical protein
MLLNQRQLTLIKKGHTYLFRFKPGEESVVREAINSKVVCGDLDWFDVAMLMLQLKGGKGEVVMGEVD